MGTLSICPGTRSTLNMPRATDIIGTPGTCFKTGKHAYHQGIAIVLRYHEHPVTTSTSYICNVLCQGRLADSSLQVFVVGANDVTSVSVYSGVDAIICVDAFVLTCQPMESSAFSWQLESNYSIFDFASPLSTEPPLNSPSQNHLTHPLHSGIQNTSASQHNAGKGRGSFARRSAKR